MTDRMVCYSFNALPELMREVKDAAKSLGISQSEFIRRALEAYLNAYSDVDDLHVEVDVKGTRDDDRDR